MLGRAIHFGRGTSSFLLAAFIAARLLAADVECPAPAPNNIMRGNDLYAAPFEGCDGSPLRVPPPASISFLLRVDSEGEDVLYKPVYLGFVHFVLQSSLLLGKIGPEKTATYPPCHFWGGVGPDHVVCSVSGICCIWNLNGERGISSHNYKSPLEDKRPII